jgi:carboxymethylenebutenolidase
VDAAANKAIYKIGNTEVSGYFYRPSGTGPFPAVLVLHGKGGQNLSIRDRASWFATQGYVAFAPDYFTPIGMTAEKFDVTFYKNSVDQVREVLGQGLEALKSLSHVAPGRLGVYGHSLGGYLSFILGTRDDVKGIISCSGAYAPTAPARYALTDICSEMKAAVIMFHCDADTLVPIDQANTASNMLKSKGKQYEYIVYPGGGHVFDVPGGPTYSATATADFQQKMAAFLKEKLQ